MHMFLGTRNVTDICIVCCCYSILCLIFIFIYVFVCAYVCV